MDILTRFNMTDCRPVKTPMTPNAYLSTNDPLHEGNFPYAEAVGCLGYLADCTRVDIARAVLAESAKLLLSGAAAGLFITLFVTKPLAMFLVPGLRPSDPISFLVVVLVLSAAGLLATLGPVRRALAVDPVTALRTE